MTIREMVAGFIPDGAFLRRDRGRGLYVTDAPARGGMAVPAGFRVESDGRLAHIYIDDRAMEEIAGRLELSSDALSEELERFRGGSREAAELFSDILKALEAPGGADIAGLDRRVRQAAAVALRAGGGEGLYYCARALAELKNNADKRREV
jgi:hypothetical protein